MQRLAHPKILFIGGTPRGEELLKRLIARNVEIVKAFITPEDPHEPYQVSRDIQKLCDKHKIPAVISKRIEQEQVEEILKLKPDVGFVCGWRTIIPKGLYQEIPYGCLAVHDSLLPKYRGFAPTAWAIINGEQQGGVTLFQIDERGVDAGDIAGQQAVPIGEHDTSTEVYPKIVEACVKLFEDFLDNLASGQVKFTAQDDSQATTAKRRTPADGQIQWDQPAKDVYNFLRALMPPYPYPWMMQGREKIFITKFAWPGNLSEPDKAPGTVMQAAPEGVSIACQDGQVIIQEVMDESGKKFPAPEKLSQKSVGSSS